MDWKQRVGKKQESQPEVCTRNENAEVIPESDKEGQYITNKHIRGALKVDRIGQKVRQSRLIWYDHVKHQDEDFVGRKVLGCSCL